MRPNLRKRTAIAALLGVLLIAAASPVTGRDSRLLQVVKVDGDPGLIEVTLQSVDFGSATGTTMITMSVACVDLAALNFVDISLSEARGSSGMTGEATLSPGCNEPFSAAISANGSEAFHPGIATLDVTAFACAAGCALEHVRATVVLIPD
jgi:hypothetical protein